MVRETDLAGKYGKWCLVAGAAEGLGKAFSMEMAGRGVGVILVDMQEKLMDVLAGELEQSYRVPVRKILLDLASDEAVPALMEAVGETGCRLLVYNAAFSRVKPFLENSGEELERYNRVNVRTPLQLVHAFARLHSGRSSERKGVILMSSLAGSWGTRLLGPYAATKAFSHLLAESLYNELKNDGFDILACITGATSTPGYLASNPGTGKKVMKVMTPEKVVRSVFSSLGRSPFVVPGFNNKLIYFLLSRVLPRQSSVRIMDQAVRGLYRDRLGK
jgi:short-subunit dehydrogenase